MSKFFEVVAVLAGLGAVAIAVAVGFSLIWHTDDYTVCEWTFMMLSLLVVAVFSKGISGTSKSMEEHRGKDR